MEFKDWLYQKFVEWRGTTRNNISQFAIYLGISVSTVSAWINGTRGAPTSARMIQALVNKYGDEVYSVVGLRNTDYESVDITSLPPDLQERFRNAMSEIDSALAERHLLSDSEEGHRVIRESFGKYGLNVTVNK